MSSPSIKMNHRKWFNLKLQRLLFSLSNPKSKNISRFHFSILILYKSPNLWRMSKWLTNSSYRERMSWFQDWHNNSVSKKDSFSKGWSNKCKRIPLRQCKPTISFRRKNKKKYRYGSSRLNYNLNLSRLTTW